MAASDTVTAADVTAAALAWYAKGDCGSSSIAMCYFLTGQPGPTELCHCWHIGDLKYPEGGARRNVDCNWWPAFVPTDNLTGTPPATMSQNVNSCTPWDWEDFRRCMGFLKAVPHVRPMLCYLKQLSNWDPIIDIWDDLELLMANNDLEKVSAKLEELRTTANPQPF